MPGFCAHILDLRTAHALDQVLVATCTTTASYVLGPWGEAHSSKKIRRKLRPFLSPLPALLCLLEPGGHGCCVDVDAARGAPANTPMSRAFMCTKAHVKQTACSNYDHHASVAAGSSCRPRARSHALGAIRVSAQQTTSQIQHRSELLCGVLPAISLAECRGHPGFTCDLDASCTCPTVGTRATAPPPSRAVTWF
jgi:hypothetical protein